MTTIQPLVPDRYEPDGAVNVTELMDAGPPWHGIGLKLDQGLSPGLDSSPWCQKIIDQARKHPRWSKDFVAYVYDYIMLNQDGKKQAEMSWNLIEKHELYGPGFLPVMGDVERGGEPPPSITKTNVEHVCGSWASRIKELSGYDPTLYAGEMPRSLGITDHMGFGRLITACYSSLLPARLWQSMGWNELFGWQYVGTDMLPDGERLHGYPWRAPGCEGLCDITVITSANPLPDLLALSNCVVP